MAHLAKQWGVLVEETLETPSSFVGFGKRGNVPVVLKVVRREGDEWRCGEVLEAFGGRGVVRAYECTDGAVLLERLNPGTSLVQMAVDGHDEQATETLARVIQQMSHPAVPPGHFVTVEDWGKGFQRYRATGDRRVAPELVEEAERLYLSLCASQGDRRLLHGDLQHYNVLLDRDRGWVAIDPKGVVGELEYELGASLRNPNPELFDATGKVERRLRQYERNLKIDYDRALAWGFAQAVLSVIWLIEDGLTVHEGEASMVLANSIRPLLKL